MEIEIEGAALAPDKISNVLGSVLASLESVLDAIMSKTYGEMSGMPDDAEQPQPKAPNQQQPIPGRELT